MSDAVETAGAVAGIDDVADETALVDDDRLVEDVSVDGMCGVY